MLLKIFHLFWAIILVLLNEEGAATYWRYMIKLSPFQTFIVVSILGLCTLVFLWLPLYKKVFMIATTKWQKIKFLRWLYQRRNYFEKNKNKKIVKKIRTYGHLGLFFGGFIPFLLHPALCAYLIFIQSRFGFICIWLGSATRLAIYVFAGLRLINLFF